MYRGDGKEFETSEELTQYIKSLAVYAPVRRPIMPRFSRPCKGNGPGLIVASRHGRIHGEDTLAGMIASRINANRERKEVEDEDSE